MFRFFFRVSLICLGFVRVSLTWVGQKARCALAQVPESTPDKTLVQTATRKPDKTLIQTTTRAAATPPRQQDPVPASPRRSPLFRAVYRL